MLAKTPRSNAAVANMEAALCLAILSVLRSSPCVFQEATLYLVAMLTRLSKNSVLVIASMKQTTANSHLI